jgi:nucleotidyltransferase/DNA polymerase involved in DNA repair
MAYPITDIRGIGPDTAAILKSEGIRTTIGLLRSARTPKQRLKLAEITGTNSERILGWVTTADRMRVRGVGAEYSELLRAVGVKTVNELKFRNPGHLVEKMSEANKRKLVRLLPKQKTVQRWIESAKKLPPLIRY